ncbi:MAG: hypothetical protein LBL48_06050 [Azoarcus sp.]|jgi:hypothetical protein|nr:hypothetical protein [Azoarcus sp.]
MIDVLATPRSRWLDSRQTVSDLIVELESFEDQNLEVLLSVDGGQTTHPITMIGNYRGRCRLEFLPGCWLGDISPETKLPKKSMPKWLACGRKIPVLLGELRAFEKEDTDRCIVMISISRDDPHPISRIEQRGEYCLLIGETDPIKNLEPETGYIGIYNADLTQRVGD